MNDDEVFLQKLREEPNNPSAHLVYADWLEEDGRLDEALAHRFIGGHYGWHDAICLKPAKVKSRPDYWTMSMFRVDSKILKPHMVSRSKSFRQMLAQVLFECSRKNKLYLPARASASERGVYAAFGATLKAAMEEVGTDNPTDLRMMAIKTPKRKRDDYEKTRRIARRKRVF